MCNPSLNRGQQGIVKASRLYGGSALSRWDGAKPRHHTMHGLKPFDTLGRYPILLAGRLGYHSSIFESQAIKESLPAGSELRLVFLRTGNFFSPAPIPAYAAHRATHRRRAHQATPPVVPAQSPPDRARRPPQAPMPATPAASQLPAPGAPLAAHRRGMRTDSH